MYIENMLELGQNKHTYHVIHKVFLFYAKFSDLDGFWPME